MVFDTIGEVDIRGENISRAVKGFAMKQFKLRQILKVESSSNLTETYYKESNTILTANGNRNIQGVARGALPPEMSPSWEKTSSDHIKFMGQETIYYEDNLLHQFLLNIHIHHYLNVFQFPLLYHVLIYYRYIYGNIHDTLPSYT